MMSGCWKNPRTRQSLSSAKILPFPEPFRDPSPAACPHPQYKTLSDAWSGIIASNAIHELTATSKRFQKWMNEPGKNGKPRIVDFQLNRCVGRLRRTHIYSDTIAILKEMLAEEGMEGKFDNILSQNDFFPESFFYQFLGSPENVFLYSEIFGKYIHRNMQNSD